MLAIITIITLLFVWLFSFLVPKGITGGALPPTILQHKIQKQYRRYKLPKSPRTFDDFCKPKKFKLQPPQEFIADYMAPGKPAMNLLGFHKIGAGKTCAAITAAKRWLKYGKPTIVMPASLLPGFRNELRGPCGGYLTSAEYKELGGPRDRHRALIAQSNKLMDEHYNILSYNKFATNPPKTTPLLIIDEVQNINNVSGTYYKLFHKYITARPDMKVIVFSATPIFDKPEELVSLLRLLRQDIDRDLITEPITAEKELILCNALSGLISYYSGAPAFTFPRINLYTDICKMSKFQTKWYQAEVEAEIKRSGKLKLSSIEDNFYTKSRSRSNIVFPRGLSGTDGLPKMTLSKIKELRKYSCKFAKLVKRLKHGQLSFVYTSFVSFGGIKTIKHCLQMNAFKDFSKHGPGPKRFAIWTGSQSSKEKDLIRATYNSDANDDASQLQIIIGSPAMKEGVSLFRTRQVHVMEPYWNHSRLAQIYGRAVRFCSHKSLPSRQRYVDIYLYVAVANWSKLRKYVPGILPEESIDMYILSIADNKQQSSGRIIDIMTESAVDRLLNQN